MLQMTTNIDERKANAWPNKTLKKLQQMQTIMNNSPKKPKHIDFI